MYQRPYASHSVTDSCGSPWVHPNMTLPPLTRPKNRLDMFARLLKWMAGWFFSGRPARKVLRKASRLEQSEMLPEAYRETLRAWRILHKRWLAYWNPILFELRMDCALCLDRLAIRLDEPPPRDQIEEVIESFKMMQQFDDRQLQKDLADTVAYLKARLGLGQESPKQ